MDRLICDQFGGCEIGKSDIAAAGGDGFGRLINTVQLRLDAGELDRLEVKPAGIKLPDHPAPDVPIRCEKKQCGQVAVRHSKTALTPVLPALPMTLIQEKADGAAIEILLQAGPKPRVRFREKAIPDELVEIQRTGHDPFIQADAQFQRAWLLTSEVHTVLALRVLVGILETGGIPAVTSGFEIGRGHHLPFQMEQRCILHEIVCHKVKLIPSFSIS